MLRERLLAPLAAWDLPVLGVVTDGQESLRQAVAAIWPGTPHQVCQFHALREAGRLMYERDRAIKVHLRAAVQDRIRVVQHHSRASLLRSRSGSWPSMRRGFKPLSIGMASSRSALALWQWMKHWMRWIRVWQRWKKRSPDRLGGQSPRPPTHHSPTTPGLGHRPGVPAAVPHLAPARRGAAQSNARSSRDRRCRGELVADPRAAPTSRQFSVGLCQMPAPFCGSASALTALSRELDERRPPTPEQQ